MEDPKHRVCRYLINRLFYKKTGDIAIFYPLLLHPMRGGQYSNIVHVLFVVGIIEFRITFVAHKGNAAALAFLLFFLCFAL